MRRSIQAIVTSILVLLVYSRISSAEQVQLVVDGRARTYLLERPPAQGPRPTIIMLHGYTGSASQIAQQTGLAEPAKQAGFAAVFPEGPAGRWNLLPPNKQTARYVKLFQSGGGVPDDVAFLKTLISDLNRRDISDPKRIYLAGRSLGGAMALRMTCVDARMFAAVALLISAMPEETGEACRPAQPIPVLLLNVTGDPMVPYAGGRIGEAGLPSGVTNIWSAERLLAFFRKLNGCNETPEHAVSLSQNPQSPRHDVQHWTSCSGGPVIFHSVVADKHIVPPSLNVAELLIGFFRDKSR